jgi:WD40 repeat protein
MTIWTVETGEVAAVLPGMGGDRAGAAFSPDGSLLVTSRLFGSTALWNMTTITNQTVNRADVSVPSRSILTVDWSQDGYLIAMFDAAGPIYIWGVPQQVPAGS